MLQAWEAMPFCASALCPGLPANTRAGSSSWHHILIINGASSAPLSNVPFSLGTPFAWFLSVKKRMGKSLLLKELFLWLLITDRVSKFLHLECPVPSTNHSRTVTHLSSAKHISCFPSVEGFLWSSYCQRYHTYTKLAHWWKPQIFAIYDWNVTFPKFM